MLLLDPKGLLEIAVEYEKQAAARGFGDEVADDIRYLAHWIRLSAERIEELEAEIIRPSEAGGRMLRQFLKQRSNGMSIEDAAIRVNGQIPKVPLKTLEEHNKERRPQPRDSLTGIFCPECGAELVETSPGMMLMSLPPHKQIHCPECGWLGACLA